MQLTIIIVMIFNEKYQYIWTIDVFNMEWFCLVKWLGYINHILNQQHIVVSEFVIRVLHQFSILILLFFSGTSFGCLLTSFFLSYDLDPGDPTPPPPVDGPKYHCGPHFCPRGPTRPSNSIEKPSDVSPYLFPNAWAISKPNSYSKYSQSYSKSVSTTLTPGDFPDHSLMSEADEILLMVGIHVMCTAVAICVILFFVDPLPKEKFVDSAAQQAKRSIVATLRQLKRKRQLLMTVLNVYVGMSRSLMLADIAQVTIAIQ